MGNLFSCFRGKDETNLGVSEYRLYGYAHGPDMCMPDEPMAMAYEHGHGLIGQLGSANIPRYVPMSQALEECRPPLLLHTSAETISMLSQRKDDMFTPSNIVCQPSRDKDAAAHKAEYSQTCGDLPTEGDSYNRIRGVPSRKMVSPSKSLNLYSSLIANTDKLAPTQLPEELSNRLKDSGSQQRSWIDGLRADVRVQAPLLAIGLSYNFEKLKLRTKLSIRDVIDWEVGQSRYCLYDMTGEGQPGWTPKEVEDAKLASAREMLRKALTGLLVQENPDKFIIAVKQGGTVTEDEVMKLYVFCWEYTNQIDNIKMVSMNNTPYRLRLKLVAHNIPVHVLMLNGKSQDVVHSYVELEQGATGCYNPSAQKIQMGIRIFADNRESWECCRRLNLSPDDEESRKNFEEANGGCWAEAIAKGSEANQKHYMQQVGNWLLMPPQHMVMFALARHGDICNWIISNNEHYQLTVNHRDVQTMYEGKIGHIHPTSRALADMRTYTKSYGYMVYNIKGGRHNKLDLWGARL